MTNQKNLIIDIIYRHITKKELPSRIYEELQQISMKKDSQPKRKMKLG